MVVPAGALGGAYSLELLTVACTGDCIGSNTLLGPVTYCDVGDHDSDYAVVAHDGDRLVVDLDRGRMQGTITDDGEFDLSGEATEAGGSVVLTATITGGFAGRHEVFTGSLAYVARGNDGGAVDCRGEIEVTGTWESDECSDDASACPEAFPICRLDACNAGVAGDPCDADEHCTDGRVCFEQACRDAAGVGGACLVDAHCGEGLRCYEEACQAGAVGDACAWDDHCSDGNLCVGDRCEGGAVGDRCEWDDDCDDLHCYDARCQAGDVGEPCGSATHCAEGNACVDGHCTAGDPGDPCLWQEDCDSHECVDDVCG